MSLKIVCCFAHTDHVATKQNRDKCKYIDYRNQLLVSVVRRTDLLASIYLFTLPRATHCYRTALTQSSFIKSYINIHKSRPCYWSTINEKLVFQLYKQLWNYNTNDSGITIRKRRNHFHKNLRQFDVVRKTFSCEIIEYSKGLVGNTMWTTCIPARISCRRISYIKCIKTGLSGLLSQSIRIHANRKCQ